MFKKKLPNSTACSRRGCRESKNKAQVVLEFAVVIICVVLALLAMQFYIKRSMQGRLRQIGDELGQQYDPNNTVGRLTTTYSSSSTTQAEKLSERQLSDKYGRNVDLDGDGLIENDVFATETLSTLDSSTTTRIGEERVGEE